MAERDANGLLIPTTPEEQAMFDAGGSAAAFQIAFVIQDWESRPAPTAEEWPVMVKLVTDYIRTMKL